MRIGQRVLRQLLQVLIAVLAVGVLSPKADAQKKPKKKRKNSSGINILPGEQFTPTRTFAFGTAGSYFFPIRAGAHWTLRTIQALYNDSAKIVRADTVYNRQTVVDSARFSIQGLPLLVCRDYSYRSGATDTLKSESYYYVDDSIAMTVFNNSIAHRQNRIFLVAPIEIGNHWHDQYDDTTVTMIVGYTDSVVTPAGKFDSVLITLTKREYSDLRKFFAPRTGIVKTVFRTVGPGGHGLVVITMEMIEIDRSGEHSELYIKKD
ncbi:MAG TPA: hypothetical protein VFO76_08335 [Candidatus Kapabacteria bacterium]|nr:hypothetical protein [Candidatus Kapabacteria bacterium]